MTKQEAVEAFVKGLEPKMNAALRDVGVQIIDTIEAATELEREACAQLAESVPEIAAAIRGRRVE